MSLPNRRLLAVLILAIAVAGCTQEEREAPPVAVDGSTVPGDAEGAPTILRTDFQVTYRLEGLTADSSMIGLLTNPQLRLEPAVAVDSTVVAGQSLGVATVDPQVIAQLDGATNRTDLDRARLSQLEDMGGPVAAPADGVFSEREGVPVLLANGIDVVVNLTPIQYLRYRSFRFTGQAIVETVIGNRQVPCVAVWSEVAAAPSAQAPSSTDGTVSALLHCRLPRLVETAAGLRARLVLETQLVADAVVVVNTFIGYDAARDEYYLIVREGGTERRIPVVVGATDGVRRIITSEVPVGAELVRPPQDGTIG